MIHYLKGKITGSEPGMVILEAGGIGYELNVPAGSPLALAQPDEELTVYTAMIVREDDVSLYGFPDRDSLSMFRLLTTVSGVGAKASLAILSVLSPAEVAQAVVMDDTAAISRANGVGKKMAQRVVLDLKDKVDAFAVLAAPRKKAEAPKKDAAMEQAEAALMSLGLTRTEALSALANVKEEGLSVEELISRALRSR